jgi:uncharacterized protein (TIGR02996 family)
MPDRNSFLAAIRANPDEDAPIFVFVDWLEEQGETEEAELLRVQCELRRTPRRLEEGEVCSGINQFRENPRWVELQGQIMALELRNPGLGLSNILDGARIGDVFQDAFLGRVQWNATVRCWEFQVGPIEGLRVPGRFAPAGREADADQWDGVRSCAWWAKVHARARSEQKKMLLTEIFIYGGREMQLFYSFLDRVLCVRLDPRGKLLGSSTFTASA